MSLWGRRSSASAAGEDCHHPVVVSIHDVMPESLEEVENLLGLLARHRVAAATLLVVPGRNWSVRELAVLRSWQEAGWVLAGHGWRHRCGPPKTLVHRLHSRLISRDVAEHLALCRRQIVDLMRRCHQWFADNRLSSPTLYVPPAWALGAVRRRDLCGLPFRTVETLLGLFDPGADRFFPLPMAGFEADTAPRAVFLKGSNAVNRWWARRTGRPLRVALHPFDLRYRLVGDLCRMLSGPFLPVGYEQAMEASFSTPPHTAMRPCGSGTLTPGKRP